jgi:Tfp pilus assembly ATPase PilU
MLMLPFFKLMADKQASDIFFTAEAPPQIKIDGITCPSTTSHCLPISCVSWPTA